MKTYKKFVDEAAQVNSDSAYRVAKAAHEHLTQEHERCSAAIKRFPTGTGPMGLTPDSVKSDPEFQKAKRQYNAAFNNLRNFNARYQKQFKKQIAADREAARAAKMK